MGATIRKISPPWKPQAGENYSVSAGYFKGKMHHPRLPVFNHHGFYTSNLRVLLLISSEISLHFEISGIETRHINCLKALISM